MLYTFILMKNVKKLIVHLTVHKGVRSSSQPPHSVRFKDSKYLGGRPDKKAIVQEWRKKKPWGKKTDCQRDTGLSRPTISKYWNVETDE